MAVDSTTAAFAAQEFRYAELPDTSISTKHPFASEVQHNSLLALEADANSLAAAEQAFYGPDVDFEQMRIHGVSNLTLGQCLTLPDGRLAFVEQIGPTIGALAKVYDVLLRVKRN